MIKHISRDQINDHLRNGDAITLVEALPEEYYQYAHLPGAIQMDYTEVNEKAPTLLPNKDAKIVVYCASTESQNSTKGARALEALGYTNVHEYVEGKQDWIEAGLPTESNNGSR
ncbi:MAG: rhodanese-like domain-containing protein [Thermodesulfobacteriota bacterium]